MNEEKKTPRKSKREIVLVVAVILAVLTPGFLSVNAFTGNPISILLAKRTAKSHLLTCYAQSDLKVDRVAYNFKDGCYYAHVSNPDNIDGNFALTTNGLGKLLSDDYVDRVTSGWNTAMRLNEEYRALVDSVLEAKDFPFTCDVGYGELPFHPTATEDEKDDCLHMSELEPGRSYDISALAKELGRLVLYVDSDEVTESKAAEVLLDIKTLMDEAEVPFHTVNFTLQAPRQKDGSRGSDGTVMVLDFPYSDIHKDNMEDRIHTGYQAALEYYGQKDAKKDADCVEW